MPNHCNLADSVITCRTRKQFDCYVFVLPISASADSQVYPPQVSVPSQSKQSDLNLQAALEEARCIGEWGQRFAEWALWGWASLRGGAGPQVHDPDGSWAAASVASHLPGAFSFTQVTDTKMWEAHNTIVLGSSHL